MNLLQFAPAFLGSISFYLACYNLVLHVRLKSVPLPDRLHLYFAILCLFIGIYDFLCTGLYLATTTQEGVVWQWWQFITSQIITISFIWFLHEYMGAPKKQIIARVTVVLLICLCISSLAPMTWSFFTDVTAIKTFTLGSTIYLTFYEVQHGILYFTMNTIYVIVGFYFLYHIILYYRRRRKESRLFLAGCLTYFFCGINDMFVTLGTYPGLYLMEYSYIALIMLMTLSILDTIVNTLQQMHADALDVSKLKSNMITYATHELKTPLIPILGWVDLLKIGLANGKNPAELIGMAEVNSIQNATERLARIIDEFLDLGRIEAGRMVLHKDHYHLTDLLSNAISMVFNHAQNAHIMIQNDVPDIIIFCDQMRIEQVFVNLLFNAIKFSPANTTIGISSQMSNKTATISIRDEGYGFSSVDLKNVWQPFSHDPQSGERVNISPSTGVGLYLCKEIVELHAGSIKIESPGPNLGTTVTVTLPLEKKAN